MSEAAVNDNNLRAKAEEFEASAVGFSILQQLYESDFKSALKNVVRKHGAHDLARSLGGAAIAAVERFTKDGQ